MVTLHDVAARAGVSKTLVSRVVNKQRGVSDASRQKILAAMQDMGYSPNALARSLVLQKTGVIGVVLDSLCETYYFSFIRGVQDAIERSGYDVLFCSGNNDVAIKERNVRFFADGRADGVIIYGSDISDITLIEKMAQHPFPFVAVEYETQLDSINQVVLDNALGARLAVEHLIRQGCRSIWHFSGVPGKTISLRRREGYIQAMKENGLQVDESMIMQSNFVIEDNRALMKSLLEQKRSLPDGIFCSCDVAAFGVLIALREAGIEAPRDIKIVGFDNDDFHKADIALPRVTTLEQPLYEMGVGSVELLLRSIKRPSPTGNTRSFAPRLLVRETTLP